MTNLFLKLFVKNNKNITDSAVRENVGKMAGIVCIVLNLLLACSKIVVGALFSVLSVLADGNNTNQGCGRYSTHTTAPHLWEWIFDKSKATQSRLAQSA